MAAIPWMPLYVSEYLGDTGHLSTLQHGAYLLLIFHYWQNDGLPEEDDAKARIARLTMPEWKRMRSTIAALFMSDWRHKRIDKELAEARKTIDKRSAAGRAGASARYSNRIATAVANAEQSNAPLPKPVPEPKEEDNHPPLLNSARELLTRVCKQLRVDLQGDPERVTWSREIEEMLRDGLTDAEIMRATETARTRGKTKLSYIRAIAMNPPKPAQTAGPKGPNGYDAIGEALVAKFAAEDEAENEQKRRVQSSSKPDAGGIFPAVACGKG